MLSYFMIGSRYISRKQIESLERKAGCQIKLAELLKVNPRTIRKWKKHESRIRMNNLFKINKLSKEKRKSFWKKTEFFSGTSAQVIARYDTYERLESMSEEDLEEYMDDTPEILSYIKYLVNQGLMKIENERISKRLSS